jgi:hypothetical protein
LRTLPRSIESGLATKGSVRISEGSSYRHTNGCFPSQSQLIVDKKSSGNYQDKVKHDALKDIIAVLKPGRHVDCALLRDMMRPLYPPTIGITAQDVWNLRCKVKKLLLQAESSTIDTRVPLAPTFRAPYMSAFSRHKSSTTNLFTGTQDEDGVLQAEPLRSQGPPREQGGRLKRLKGNQEKAVRGLPMALSQSTPRRLQWNTMLWRLFY